MSDTADLLCAGLRELGLPPEGPLASGLERYLAAIEEWNPAYGLVGAAGAELVVKHALDSLAPLAILDGLASRARAARSGSAPISLADLGTGAGLPGIPLALARPEWRVALVDRMTRRIRFLEAMRSELELHNVEIQEEQVEHAGGTYDLLTFRAFRPFERKLFKKVFRLCAPGGFLAAYKGRMDKAQAELEEIAGLYGGAEILPIKVPFLEDERCLVVLSPVAS